MKNKKKNKKETIIIAPNYFWVDLGGKRVASTKVAFSDVVN